MVKHFALTSETVFVDGYTLHRIMATQDLPQFKVKQGDLGGFIESEKNLSGKAWVSERAKVYGDALVTENALVRGDAKVYGQAKIYGRAIISGESIVTDKAQVYGAARVFDEAIVYGEALVFEKAFIGGKSRVGEKSIVRDCAVIFNQMDIVHVPNALGISGWSDKSYSVTGFRTASGEPYVVFDAKVGHAEKLVDFVKEYHKHLSHQKGAPLTDIDGLIKEYKHIKKIIIARSKQWKTGE